MLSNQISSRGSEDDMIRAWLGYGTEDKPLRSEAPEAENLSSPSLPPSLFSLFIIHLQRSFTLLLLPSHSVSLSSPPLSNPRPLALPSLPPFLPLQSSSFQSLTEEEQAGLRRARSSKLPRTSAVRPAGWPVDRQAKAFWKVSTPTCTSHTHTVASMQTSGLQMLCFKKKQVT